MRIAKKWGKFTAYTALVNALALTYTVPVKAQSINTVSIAASTVSPSCAAYNVVGICSWLKCHLFGCYVVTSAKVHHFIPEMIVSVYNHDNQSPWTEVKWMNSGTKGGAHTRIQSKYSQYRFKNAEAIGHPGGAALQQLSKSLPGYACESQTQPYRPYFLSGLDFLAWNNNTLESFYPESLVPYLRDVGSVSDMWGNLYPRSGHITQTHDYKASAVVAQRVADIVSRNGQLHLYSPVQQSDGKGKWFPKEVKEGEGKTHKWQLLSPKIEFSCKTFPHSGELATHSDRLSNEQSYSWALWRPYACCKKVGHRFLGAIDWISTHTH